MTIKAIAAYQPTRSVPDKQDLVRMQMQPTQAINELLARVAVLEREASQNIIKIAWLSATEVSNPQNFVQGSGSTAGLGVNTFSGLAICNGNNGTPDLADVFLRWSTTQADSSGGSDTNSHTHDAGGLIARIMLTTSNAIRMDRVSSSTWGYNYTAPVTVSSSSGTTTVGARVEGDSAAPSDTNNMPAYKTAVPLMRVR